MEERFKFPIRTAVMCVAAALFVPLVADWVQPGSGTRCAYLVLRSTCGDGAVGVRALPCWSVWGWLVGRVGWDVVGLGAISMLGAVACAGLVAMMAGDLFRWAVSKGRALGTAEDFTHVELVGTALAGLAFMLTPEILRAATRVGPLTVWLIAPLAGLALLVHLKQRGWAIFLALVLLGYGAAEARSLCQMAGARLLVLEAVRAVGVFALVGVFPALALASLVRWRRIGTAPANELAGTRRELWWCFAAWAAAVAVMGVVAVATLGRGRVAWRVAVAIVANATEAGREAIVSDGTLDDVLAFMAPEGVKVVTMAREHEPRYGRELAAWVSSVQGPKSVAAVRCPLSSAQVEDLVFAAELGPCALIDEWVKIDKAGFEAAVATYGTYFPTVEKWREAYGIVKDAESGEPLVEYLTHLMGVCGNEIGCRLLEEGKESEAWDVFWEIADEVDRGNYAALVNLSGMLERGYKAPSEARGVLSRWRKDVETRLKDPAKVARAARSGGRLYVDPKVRERHEAARREAIERREMSPQARRFVERLTSLVRDEGMTDKGMISAAREEIKKGVGDGMVRADLIGGQLLTLDRALGNWKYAEDDAIEILRIDRHHAAANAAMGTVNARRRDWAAAERYLRRAGEDANALNDLAYVLTRTGRATEAVAFARRAVGMQPENWNFRETLGDALTCAGETAAGLEEFAASKELKAKTEGRGK